MKCSLKEGHQASPRTNMKLKFMNKISQTILTSEEIKGEGDTPIEVALVDDPSGKVVDDGPVASASVKIVLLRGEADAFEQDDWTVEQFDDNIVPEMEGKQPFLAGNVSLKIQRGIGVVKNIKLRNHTIKRKPSVFKLGARAVDVFDGVRIKEAKTESFTVKDFRKKYYRKHEIPSLSDAVSRLVNIRRGGNIDKRLAKKKIITVEDFLIRLLINRDELKTIMKIGPTKWEAAVNNALACQTNNRMYCYIRLDQKIGIVFNVLGHVLGMYFESHYHPTSMLSEEHKAHSAELLASAKRNWENVVPFDDADSLQQYLTTLIEHIDPLNSANPHCHGTMEASEMIGETSSRRSNVSFHSASSTMESFRELASGDEANSSGADDFESMFDAAVHSPSTIKSYFPNFEDYLPKTDTQHNGSAVSAAADAFVECEVVQTSNPPKRWNTLLCVLRWFFIRKKVSVDVPCNRKKQKIG